MNNRELRNRLMTGVYAEPALVPQLREVPVRQPVLSAARQANGKQIVRWSLPAGQKASRWIVQIRRGRDTSTEVLPGSSLTKEVSGSGTIVVTALSRFRVLSGSVSLQF